MKFLVIAAFLSSFALADEEVSSLEKEIKDVEDQLEAKVKKYNEALRSQHQVKTLVQNDSKSVTTVPELSKEELVDAKFKELTDKFERLEKTVKDIQQELSKSKPNENLTSDEATKKVTLEDKHEIKTEPGQAQFDLAVKIMYQDPTKSIQSFSDVMKDHKGKPIATSAAIKIGEAYLKLGKWELAYKTFQNALELKNITVTQTVEATLGSAEAQCENSNRKAGCKTLIHLERANTPMTKQQTDRYQALIVTNHCASGMDRDKKNDVVKTTESTGEEDD